MPNENENFKIVNGKLFRKEAEVPVERIEKRLAGIVTQLQLTVDEIDRLKAVRNALLLRKQKIEAVLAQL